MNLEQVLTEIAGKNVLTGQNKDVEKLVKAVNYLSTQLSVQLRCFVDDETNSEAQKSAEEVRQQTVKILKPKN